MTRITFSRRRLLKIGLTAGAIAALPAGCSSVSEPAIDRLLKRANDTDQLANPNQTGALKAAEFDLFSSLCRFVDTTWALRANLPAYLSLLQSDLALKTGRSPSYLTEYRRAHELFVAIRAESDSVDQAWTTLLFADFEAEDLGRTWIGRARRFVFAEAIAHQVPLSAGFRTFDLVNYRGYFGGPYASAASYRRDAV